MSDDIAPSVSHSPRPGPSELRPRLVPPQAALTCSSSPATSTRHVKLDSVAANG